ncbi:hypothetical protein ABVK25_002852 [Lepraria finkii]|uniref:Uncharacterized protein n=1 Tax=Lepraria finkii TaxID=1340010 RepID=A0ABR4BMD0_9LECA
MSSMNWSESRSFGSRQPHHDGSEENKGIGALVLNGRSGHFTFGNPGAASVAAKNAIQRQGGCSRNGAAFELLISSVPYPTTWIRLYSDLELNLFTTYYIPRMRLDSCKEPLPAEI